MTRTHSKMDESCEDRAEIGVMKLLLATECQRLQATTKSKESARENFSLEPLERV